MRAPRRRITVGGVLLIAAAAARTVTAQPFTLEQTIKPTELKLEPYRIGDAAIDGRVYGAVVMQTGPTKYFFVQGLSIFSPDYVGVTADDAAAAVTVELYMYYELLYAAYRPAF